jgi:hypothetical protein
MTTGAVHGPGRRARDAALRVRSRREFRDVRHPQRPDLRVEHVLVCPSGVHVVTTLSSPARPGEPLVDPAVLLRGRAAAEVVAALLPPRYRDRVRPVLCVADDVAMAELVEEVLVTSPSTLEHIVGFSPVVLSTSEVNDVALRLDARLEPFPFAHVRTRPGWRRRAAVLVASAVAASGAAAALLAHGGVTPPW